MGFYLYAVAGVELWVLVVDVVELVVAHSVGRVLHVDGTRADLLGQLARLPSVLVLHGGVVLPTEGERNELVFLGHVTVPGDERDDWELFVPKGTGVVGVGGRGVGRQHHRGLGWRGTGIIVGIDRSRGGYRVGRSRGVITRSRCFVGRGRGIVGLSRRRSFVCRSRCFVGRSWRGSTVRLDGGRSTVRLDRGRSVVSLGRRRCFICGSRSRSIIGSGRSRGLVSRGRGRRVILRLGRFVLGFGRVVLGFRSTVLSLGLVLWLIVLFGLVLGFGTVGCDYIGG